LRRRNESPWFRELMSSLSLTYLAWAATGLAAAAAQGPLDRYLEAADEHALDVRRAASEVDLASADYDTARSRLLPSVSAAASYTRNQHEVAADLPTQRAVITPRDQVELTAELVVPLVDAGAWIDLGAASAGEDAAARRFDAARLEARVATVAAYFELVAARATEGAAREALASREHNATVAATRVRAGIGSELDLAQAEADVARAEQEIASAALRTRLAERALFVLTGLEPAEGVASLADDLRAPPPLDRVRTRLDAHPAVLAARADASRAGSAHDRAVADFFPSLSAFASERVTNASGFGEESAWSLGVRASLSLDFSQPAALAARAAEHAAREIEVDRATTEAETRLIDAFYRVEAAIARARAARAEVGARERARSTARARFAAGTGPEADLLDAEREWLASESARIAADAELLAARHTLAIRSLRDERGRR
jgi:outer membrane protein